MLHWTVKLMRRHRKNPRSKRKTHYPSFRYGVDDTPAWMDSFINSKYVIPCSAKVFGPNNKIIHQKWLYIGNCDQQLAGKGDCIIMTREGTLRVIPGNGN